MIAELAEHILYDDVPVVNENTFAVHSGYGLMAWHYVIPVIQK